MSEEQLKAFVAKVQSDPSLQDKLKADISVADLVAIAKSNGFQFTEEDLKPYREKKLSDQELEAVAGGGIDVNDTVQVGVSILGFGLCMLFGNNCYKTQKT